ncbi:B-cell receptor CD22-like [Colossoma macropomum]|uniref:B-cell receptor CD22-like n=1 Tax=Colossoma macropomum TaxID=42526 RepID=UPI0018651530|nr:B-cell receptor CD22-like [Colossoma macropomum]
MLGKRDMELLYSSVTVRSATSDATHDPDPSNQDDVHYASVVPRKVRNPRNAESSAVTASGTDEEVQYTSVQHHCDKVVEKTEEDEVQYTTTGCTPDLRMSLTVSLLFLLFISGVFAQDGWSVYYNSKSICALKESNVTMGCTYSCPSGHSVQKAFWTKYWIRGAEPPDLLDDPEYRGRVQYLGDKFNYCTLRLSDVTEKDQRKYYFRFLTDQPGGKYQGAGGVDLSVTDLQVEVPERVIEGDKVTLTCKTTCSLTVRPTFSWYRNGHNLSSSKDQLHLQSVSREDAGRYRCAVRGQNSSEVTLNKLHSPEVTLNVRYGPKSISVSISPSGEIVEGSSLTLTCSSDANPPVEYNWFKGTSLVAKGETYTMNKISSVDSGEYKCRSSNGYIEKHSEALTLSVLYPPKSISVSISPSGEIVEGSSVTLTCSSDANPPVQKFAWFKKLNKGTLQKSTSQIYSISYISSADSGEYRCMATNTQGSRYSEYKSLTVLYAPKKALVSISETAEDSSATLTCSSDANPPVQNYTWFKEGGSSPVGSGHSYSALQSASYYCVAQNEHRSQRSAAVTVTVKAELSMILYVVVGLGLCVVAVFIAITLLIWYKVKKKKRTMEEDDHQNVDPNAKDDTYTALDPMSRSSDDVYSTLAAINNKR